MMLYYLFFKLYWKDAQNNNAFAGMLYIKPPTNRAEVEYITTVIENHIADGLSIIATTYESFLDYKMSEGLGIEFNDSDTKDIVC